MKKDLAQVIQNEMDKRGWSDIITSEKSGVPQQTIYRIVHRQVAKPHKSTITMLAAAFGMTYIQLLSKIQSDDVIQSDDAFESADSDIIEKLDHMDKVFKEVDLHLVLMYKAMCQAIKDSGKKLTPEEVALLFNEVLNHELKPSLTRSPIDESVKSYIKNVLQIK